MPRIPFATLVLAFTCAVGSRTATQAGWDQVGVSERSVGSRPAPVVDPPPSAPHAGSIAQGAPAGDCAGGFTERITVSTNGVGADDRSYFCDISADGRFVVFTTEADNLVPGDLGGDFDLNLLLRDRVTGSTTAISPVHEYDWSVFPSISPDGRFVVFYSGLQLDPAFPDAEYTQCYIHDRATGTTELVSQNSSGEPGTGINYTYSSPAVSADGRYVAFSTRQVGLVDDDPPNTADVFLRDRATGETIILSRPFGVDADGGYYGARYPVMTADAAYVVFTSDSDDLVDGDTGGIDVFRYERQTDELTLVSVALDGTSGEGYSWVRPAISDDGRFIAFSSFASDLVETDVNDELDVFLRDMVNGTTIRVSQRPDGSGGDDWSGNPEITPDGRYVAFVSTASNLVDGDVNDAMDTFLYDRATDALELVSVNDAGQQQDAGPGVPINWQPLAMTADARTICWATAAENLAEDDINNATDVYAHTSAPCAVCSGDVHPPGGDGQTDAADLLAMLGGMASGDLAFDIAPPPDGDGLVDVQDLLELLIYWGACP